MNLLELIEAVGLDNIEIQNLNKGILNASVVKGDTVIKFVTKSMTPTDLVLGTKTGLVLWIDSSKLNAAMAGAESEKAAES